MMRFVVFALAAVAPAVASVTCLTVGNVATARWINNAAQACTWTGTVGSNFGVNAVNDGEYSCNGRSSDRECLVSSIQAGHNYTLILRSTQDCFSHDICSYFNNASGGASDPNCGAAFRAAEDDTEFGWVNGCGQRNPNVAPVAPTVQPVCE